MKNMIPFLSCALLVALSAPASAAPPDWLSVSTAVGVSNVYSQKTPISTMSIPVEVTIKNNSRFRAVMKLTNIRYTISGQIVGKFYKGAEWDTNPVASRVSMPAFKNQVITLRSRDVEIMPGDVYKQKYNMPITWFAPKIGRFTVVQAGLRVSHRYFDFDVETREMSTIRGVRRRD